MKGYRMLQEHTKGGLKKRQAPAKSVAPKSLVEAIQDEAPKGGWNNPAVKRRKIRYGPYRIPAISVRLQLK
jgi:hypothetical protein